MANNRRTTAYFTLRIERDGASGPQNERDIEKIVQAIRNLSKGRTGVYVGHHDYQGNTETLGS